MRILALLLLPLCLSLPSCADDDDPVVPNEEEVITDVTFTLVPTTGTGETVVFSFVDRDGDGPVQPDTSQTGTLLPSTTYNGKLTFTNASDTLDVEDVTAEVRTEALDHQVFFTQTAGLNLTVTYADVDTGGNPLGLETTVTTGAPSSGNFTIILRHEPDKSAAGVSISNPTPAGGETDVEVTFATSY